MATVEQAETAPTDNRQYGHSVLATACKRWWRGAVVMLSAIVVNALVQMLLIAGDPTPGSGVLGVFTLLALCSLVMVILAGSLITATALSVSAGRVGFAAAFSLARRHFWLFAGWAIVWGVVVTIGMMIYTIPGALIAAVTPFVLLAAADGQKNAVSANFRAIGNRFGRFIVTLIISGILLFIFHLLSAANTFFIAGSASVFIMWFVFGLLSSWLAVGWALLYRSTSVGATGDVNEDQPTSP